MAYDKVMRFDGLTYFGVSISECLFAKFKTNPKNEKL